MVVSIRVSEEQEQKYRRFAEQQGLTISEFMRRCADDAIAQAEEVLRKADEERKHAEEVADFRARFEAFLEVARQTPTKELSEEDIAALRIARYA